MARWETVCPTDGTCTECGLGFGWREILGAEVKRPRWCVEYASGRWRTAVAIVSTLVHAGWPWGFWKRIDITCEVRPKRLVLFIAVLLILTYVAVGLSNVAAEMRDALFPPAPIGATALVGFVGPTYPTTVGGWVTTALVPWLGGYWRPYWTPVLGVAAALLFVHILSTTGFLVLPMSRRVAKVRWIHVFRIATYGTTLLVPVILCWLLAAVVSIYDWFLGDRFNRFAIVVTVAFVPAHVIWWSTACGRYLRMRHPWGIGIVLTTLGFLLTLHLMVVLFLVTG
jgi:hypothetical protein